jgi:hypothetical protein
MQDLDDKRIEWLLERHFAKELDPQLGLAAKRFLRDVRQDQPVRNFSPWWTWAGAALAASVLISWGLHNLHVKFNNGIPSPIGPIVDSRPASDVLEPVSQQVSWQTVDDGTVVLEDDRPARRVRRQVVERLCWYDPKEKTTVELTVPHEQVLLIGLNSY